MTFKTSYFVAGLTLAVTVLFLGGTGTAQAEDYTGCVTPGGTITHLAIGQSPLKPCTHSKKPHKSGKSEGSHVIHLADTNANQHVSAHINLAELCKVLASAGLDTSALGCHSFPDDQCIAAEYDSRLRSDVERDCRLYHYSDNPKIQMYNEYCGSGSVDNCKQEIATAGVSWWLKAECHVSNPPS